MKPLEKQVEDFKRQLLSRYVGQLTDEQYQFLKRLWPDEVPAASLNSVIELVMRTLAKNGYQED